MRPLTLMACIAFTFVVSFWFAVPGATRAAPQWQDYDPPLWILGPIQGADGNENTVLKNLRQLEEWNIPITAFHFDGPDWQLNDPDNPVCAFQFGYSDAVLDWLRARGIRAMFWIVPLVDMDKCTADYYFALANDYFVKDAEGNVIVTDNFTGQGSWIDFANPGAVAYWRSRLDSLLARTGDVVGGFYTDNTAIDSAYGEAYSADLLEYTRTHIPDGDVVMKRYASNSPSDAWLEQYAHVAYVNDLPTNFAGLKTGIERVLNTTQLMPLPFNEFSGYAETPPDAETYIRRMHWGAFQAVMENVPKTANPWNSIYPDDVMKAYRYYATLHWELQPYLHSYDQAAFERREPIFRDFNLRRYSTRVGDAFFVAFVTSYTRSLQVKLPPGTWIDYWDERKTYTGPATITVEVPLGREPIFIAQGAIIPMQVRNGVTGHGTKSFAGALTVNVYPAQHSTFRYHDVTNGWLTFEVTRSGERIALCTRDGVPSQPIIYRIARLQKKPKAVKALNGAVGINTVWGDALPKLENEFQVGTSSGGWFYDRQAKRLSVKNPTLGTDCPAP